MENETNKDLVTIKVSTRLLDWIEEEKQRVRKAQGKKPTTAALMNFLLDYLLSAKAGKTADIAVSASPPSVKGDLLAGISNKKREIIEQLIALMKEDHPESADFLGVIEHLVAELAARQAARSKHHNKKHQRAV